MLIKPARVRAGGSELYPERKNQEDMILQGKPGHKRCISQSVQKKTYDEYNPTA